MYDMNIMEQMVDDLPINSDLEALTALSEFVFSMLTEPGRSDIYELPEDEMHAIALMTVACQKRVAGEKDWKKCIIAAAEIVNRHHLRLIPTQGEH